MLITAAPDNMYFYWILVVEAVSMRSTCSFHHPLSAYVPLLLLFTMNDSLSEKTHHANCLTDLLHGTQRLCHKCGLHDDASDLAFPHVNWQL